MADRMMPPGVPRGNTPAEQTESIFNPADVAKQRQMGQLRPDMTIREFFEAQGLDVDRNTLKDLAGLAGRHASNRTMAGKLRGMGATPEGGPPPVETPPPGMENLVNKLGGR